MDENGNTQNNSPLTWLGNKTTLADRIIQIMPKHNVYIESFFGSGAVFFQKKPSKMEVINDINDLLVNFWTVIKEDSDGFLEKFEYVLHSRSTFESYKDTDWKKIDRVEKAFRFYYLVRNAWCRLYRVNKEGRFNAPFSGGTNSKLLFGSRNLAKQFFDTRHMIRISHKRLENACVECLDYKDIIKKYDDHDVLYFLDPPYSTTYQYCTSFDIDEFVNQLGKIKGKFIVTLNSAVKDKFAGYHVFDIDIGAKMCSTNPDDKFNQILITNFDPATASKHGEKSVQEKVI